MNTGYTNTVNSITAKDLQQPAMSQEIKPLSAYAGKKNKLVDTLLLQSGISSYNFFWFFLIIPFALLTIIRFYGLTYAICAAFGF